MYGERLGDGVEYHLMKPTPHRYHLRRGVGFMKFLENGTRPQPPTSAVNATSIHKQEKRNQTNN